jgi:uncharacterized protein (DUF2336 family)
MSAQASRDRTVDAPSPSPAAGRRRARLVASGGAQPLSLSDVQALQGDPSPGSRAALATKFGRQYDQLIGGRTRALAEAVLTLLVRDVEPKVRGALAEAVAASTSLPHDVAARLAADDLDVARPILEGSPVLTDDDLAEIVRTHPMPYALAVARRGHLPEALSDLLADTNEPEVIAALVGNDGAELSTATLLRIREDCGEDSKVQERLLRRPNLPRVLIERLLTAIGEGVGWAAICQRCMSKAEARQLMARLRDRAAASTDAEAPEDPAIERELRHRLAAGELGPQDIVTFLRDGDIARVEAGLALLADVDPQRAGRLLHSADNRGLAALCARADFGAPHYVAVRMAMDLAERGLEGADPETTCSPETITSLQRHYDLIRGDRAQIALCIAS